MTLEKAIEIMQQNNNNPGSVDKKDLRDAQRIGMYAITRIQMQRSEGIRDPDLLLPGETEE